jgi:hypothetical protein
MQNNVYVPTQLTQAERKSAVDSYRYRKREVERKGGGKVEVGIKRKKRRP